MVRVADTHLKVRPFQSPKPQGVKPPHSRHGPKESDAKLKRERETHAHFRASPFGCHTFRVYLVTWKQLLIIIMRPSCYSVSFAFAPPHAIIEPLRILAQAPAFSPRQMLSNGFRPTIAGWVKKVPRRSRGLCHGTSFFLSALTAVDGCFRKTSVFISSSILQQHSRVQTKVWTSMRKDDTSLYACMLDLSSSTT
jgi:hypothetical protein